MSKILIDSCEVVATMNDAGTEIPGGSILIEDGRIAWVGSGRPAAEDAQIVDKALTLAKGAKVNGDLVAGARVAVTLSVHDKDTASAVHVLKEE